MKYFNLALFSFTISFTIFFYTIALSMNNGDEDKVTNAILASASVLAFGSLILTLMFLPIILKWIENFAVKNHIKFKVTPSVEVGEVYILQMHDKETCICSKEPNAQLKDEECEFFLVPLQDIMEKPLKMEKIAKPTRSFWGKFFDI